MKVAKSVKIKNVPERAMPPVAYSVTRKAFYLVMPYSKLSGVVPYTYSFDNESIKRTPYEYMNLKRWGIDLFLNESSITSNSQSIVQFILNISVCVCDNSCKMVHPKVLQKARRNIVLAI